MRVLIYKRTHKGDPCPKTKVFGCNDCMGRVRSWSYDAVIGVGGKGREAIQERIACKLTWIGITPIKAGCKRFPKVTFGCFWQMDDGGPLLENIAPKLAARLYTENPRVLICTRASDEWQEVERILLLAKDQSRARRSSPSLGRCKVCQCSKGNVPRACKSACDKDWLCCASYGRKARSKCRY